MSGFGTKGPTSAMDMWAASHDLTEKIDSLRQKWSLLRH